MPESPGILVAPAATSSTVASEHRAHPQAGGVPDVRPPAPYRAMLAICSDLDETPDADTYFELMRFLNTTEETRMGPGVGLEVGNTLYFDMAPGQLSYWNASERDRGRFRELIRSGHIDCLHSYGDLATTRAHAGRALDELAKHDLQLPVWVDHAQAISNFGADIMRGHGDEPGHPAYHADLTLGHGVRYMWRGRVTSVIGQNRRFSLRGIADPRRPLASARTLFKAGVKQALAHLGSRKFALHVGNHLLQTGTLRDGQRAPEFIRCDPSWAGISRFDRGDGIHEVLTRRYLDRLVTRGGSSILYTHLGKLGRDGCPFAFGPKAVSAFRLLAEYHHSGRILVTTTSRLLDHQTGYRRDSVPRWEALSFPKL